MNDNDDWLPAEGENAARVTHGAPTAVVMANPNETGIGVIDFPVAMDGMCPAIGVLAQQPATSRTRAMPAGLVRNAARS
jgi:hypothetical protein